MRDGIEMAGATMIKTQREAEDTGLEPAAPYGVPQFQ